MDLVRVRIAELRIDQGPESKTELYSTFSVIFFCPYLMSFLSKFLPLNVPWIRMIPQFCFLHQVQMCITFLFLLSGVHGYAEISGSCNGVYGVHLPNEGGDDGGYRVVVSKEASPSTITGLFFANVSIQHVSLIDTLSRNEIEVTGSGSFQGFLLKSFDKVTGEPLGTFMDPLPKRCTFYAGCSSPRSAISHIVDGEQSEPNIYYGDGTVAFRFSWPPNAEVGFQLFVVETLTRWFEVREPSQGGAAGVGGLPMDCRPPLSPAAVAIGFAPVWILLGGALLYSPQHLHSARRTLSAALNTPLGLGKPGRGRCARWPPPRARRSAL